MTRRVLSQRRASETFDLRFWNQNLTVSVGHYPDGTPGEVFINSRKTGGDVKAIARDSILGAIVDRLTTDFVRVAEDRP